MKNIDTTNRKIDIDKEYCDLVYQSFLHEVKNPISILKGNINLLELNNPEIENLKQWSSIKNNLDYLCNLLNDFTEFSNTLTLNKTEFNLVSLLYEVHSMFNFVAQEKNINLHIVNDCDENILISGDRRKIKQALINLVKNSLEACSCCDSYERCNDVQIYCNKKEDKIELVVEDTGCGIPMDQIDIITTPYITYKDGGTGLGLPFVKWVTEKHKGCLTIESDLNKGSKFILTFQL